MEKTTGVIYGISPIGLKKVFLDVMDELRQFRKL